MKRTRGFTLIELLVSMSLLSMIVLVGASAFGLFAQRWDGRLGSFDMTMRDAQNRMLVQDVLDSLVPYVVYDLAGRPAIYFEGNRNGFVAVSSKSIFSYGDFAVVRFSVQQNADFLFDVTYEEWPMSSNILVSVDQTLDFSEPLVIFTGVSDPLFSYFGWPDAAERLSIDERMPAPPRWSKNYDGILALNAPLKAKLSFTTEMGSYQVMSAMNAQGRVILGRYKNQQIRGLSGTLGRSDGDCAC